MNMRFVLRLGIAIAVVVGLATAQSPLEQGQAFFQSAWKRVQAEGPAAAERIVRAAPERFRKVKGRVAELQRMTREWADEKRLDERKNLAIELWRIRGSLDLMALLNPEVMESLTGVDAKTLRQLRAQVDRAQATLGKK